MTAKIRSHIFVKGKVQGVYYRQNTMEAAKANGVTGWVRNEPDGSVLAVFEGEPDRVERMCRWCRTGPDHARVSRVDVTEEEPEGLTSFVVSF